jgi:hypothetical protein
MQKQSYTLLLLLFSFLLSACAGSAAAQTSGEPSSAVPTILDPTATSEAVSRTPSADCPLTGPQERFIPPAPYDTLGFEDSFWYGSSSLWTAIWSDGIWYGLPYNPGSGYTQKIFWWRDGYVWNEESQPDLIVTGERLDTEAPPLLASKATNAYGADIGSSMLVGVDFPTGGCWKITGQYGEAELSFVVWVGP